MSLSTITRLRSRALHPKLHHPMHGKPIPAAAQSTHRIWGVRENIVMKNYQAYEGFGHGVRFVSNLAKDKHQIQDRGSTLATMNTGASYCGFDGEWTAMDEFDSEELTEDELSTRFSTVEYRNIAPFVGLEPIWNMDDAPTFDLRRSRIPTALFRDIIMDMDVLLTQYGTLQHHETEKARSRFLAPIFNHLVAQFGCSIQNTPESFINGPTTTKGKIDCHFSTLNALMVVFVEVRYKIGGVRERMSATAHVIAECDACNWTNKRLKCLGIPIHGILCDGSTFQFFTFKGSSKPYWFSMGVVPGSPCQVVPGLSLADFSSKPNASSFIHSLRPICETIFNLLLVGYIATLKAFRNRPRFQSGPQSIAGWDKAIKFAEEALEKSQDADVLRQDNSIVDADVTSATAFKALKLSTDAIPTAKGYIPLMDGWNDDEVARV